MARSGFCSFVMRAARYSHPLLGVFSKFKPLRRKYLAMGIALAAVGALLVVIVNATIPAGDTQASSAASPLTLYLILPLALNVFQIVWRKTMQMIKVMRTKTVIASAVITVVCYGYCILADVDESRFWLPYLAVLGISCLTWPLVGIPYLVVVRLTRGVPRIGRKKKVKESVEVSEGDAETGDGTRAASTAATGSAGEIEENEERVPENAMDYF
eukprot:PLAT12551.5.p1 GENE.PLAT12551.5~~PLAT12551.5.p1  ORF type:complete len:214 (+),score=64.05 PLAT12551.5:693-1334(+)